MQISHWTLKMIFFKIYFSKRKFLQTVNKTTASHNVSGDPNQVHPSHVFSPQVSYQGDDATEPLARSVVSGVWISRFAPVHCRVRCRRNRNRRQYQYQYQYRARIASFPFHTTAPRTLLFLEIHTQIFIVNIKDNSDNKGYDYVQWTIFTFH